jgi:hypothetical protein
MRCKEAPSVICRDVVLRDVPMTVYFWYYAGYEATREDPGFEGEIELESVFIDEFEVTNLFGEKALNDVEKELWKLLEEGEVV